MIDWGKYAAYREVTAYPTEFSKERFEMSALRRAAEKASVLFRGWPFLHVDRNTERTYVIGDMIETVVDLTWIAGYECFEMWQLRQSGLLFHRRLMREVTYPPALQRGKVLDITQSLYHLAEAVGSLWRLYEQLGVPGDEEVSIEFRYTDLQGRRLTYLDPERDFFFDPMHEGHICHTPEIVRARRLPLAEWRAADGDIATEVACEIFQQFQWLDVRPDVFEKQIREFLAKPRI